MNESKWISVCDGHVQLWRYGKRERKDGTYVVARVNVRANECQWGPVLSAAVPHVSTFDKHYAEMKWGNTIHNTKRKQWIEWVSVENDGA